MQTIPQLFNNKSAIEAAEENKDDFGGPFVLCTNRSNAVYIRRSVLHAVVVSADSAFGSCLHMPSWRIIARPLMTFFFRLKGHTIDVGCGACEQGAEARSV